MRMRSSGRGRGGHHSSKDGANQNFNVRDARPSRMRISWPLVVTLFNVVSLVFLFLHTRLVPQAVVHTPLISQTSVVHDNLIYGHVHMAKTAGTTLNGNLSMHYERVCGHKGYSYDAVETNKRYDESDGDLGYSGDSISELEEGHNRGRVPLRIMDEVGYQDCDWVSIEDDWNFWIETFRNWPIPLELHVPCRSPVEHLMSQCNSFNSDIEVFDCNLTGDAMEEQIEECEIYIEERFDKSLGHVFPTKCFDVARMNDYYEWIGARLQKKRIETTYVHRESNEPRHKKNECVWNRPDVYKFIQDYLLEYYDYYKFCDKCIGSKNDVLAS